MPGTSRTPAFEERSGNRTKDNTVGCVKNPGEAERYIRVMKEVRIVKKILYKEAEIRQKGADFLQGTKTDLERHRQTDRHSGREISKRDRQRKESKIFPRNMRFLQGDSQRASCFPGRTHWDFSWDPQKKKKKHESDREGKREIIPSLHSTSPLFPSLFFF